MSRRRHLPIPSHTTLAAYTALFLALTGGTALAVTAIDDNSVRSNHIVDREVKNPDIAQNAIGGGKVVDDSLTGSDVSGLTGGDVTDGSLGGADLGAGSVGTSSLADSAVTTDKLRFGAVTRTKVGPDAIGQPQMGPDSVAGSEIVDGSIRVEDIGGNAVGARQIAADAVGSSEVARGAVGADESAVVPGARVVSGAKSIPATDVTRFQCTAFDFSETRTGAFDHGDMFRPATNDSQLRVSKPGVYAISGQANWADALGKYKTSLKVNGLVVANETTRDGDRGSLSTIAAVSAAGSTLTLTACWDGFGASRSVEADSYLSAQWLGPLP